MRIIFGTTNKRKVGDLLKVINELNLDIEILSLSDIGWNLGDIEEVGETLEENSLIKAKAIYDFCVENDIHYPIITDDSGLFVEALGGEPGIYTARYAVEELEKDDSLPKYQCIIKILNKLKGILNREAYYKCIVTCMLPNGIYFQESGKTTGVIANEIIGEIITPYFYTVFIVDKYNKIFHQLTDDELKTTFRFQALRKSLQKLSKI